MITKDPLLKTNICEVLVVVTFVFNQYDKFEFTLKWENSTVKPGL